MWGWSILLEHFMFAMTNLMVGMEYLSPKWPKICCSYHKIISPPYIWFLFNIFRQWTTGRVPFQSIWVHPQFFGVLAWSCIALLSVFCSLFFKYVWPWLFVFSTKDLPFSIDLLFLMLSPLGTFWPYLKEYLYLLFSKILLLI